MLLADEVLFTNCSQGIPAMLSSETETGAALWQTIETIRVRCETEEGASVLLQVHLLCFIRHVL